MVIFQFAMLNYQRVKSTELIQGSGLLCLFIGIALHPQQCWDQSGVPLHAGIAMLNYQRVSLYMTYNTIHIDSHWKELASGSGTRPDSKWRRHPGPQSLSGEGQRLWSWSYKKVSSYLSIIYIYIYILYYVFYILCIYIYYIMYMYIIYIMYIYIIYIYIMYIIYMYIIYIMYNIYISDLP